MPDHLRPVGDNSAKTTRKETRSTPLKLSANADQKFQVRSLVKQLDPAVVRRACQLLRGSAVVSFVAAFRDRNPVRQFYRGAYHYYTTEVDGSLTAQLWSGDEFFCSGSTLEVFAYAMRYARGAVKEIVACARHSYVPHSKRGKGFGKEELEDYREYRLSMPSVNALSKFAQLPLVDQDSTVAKFYIADSESVGSSVVHYGAGNGLGFSVYATGGDALCYDPRIPESAGPLKGSSYSPELDENAEIIYSDMSFGDYHGMVIDQSLVENAITISRRSPQARVLLKLDLTEKYPGLRGFVYHKARPHNFEVIWEVDAEGDEFDQVSPGLTEQVGIANELRTRRIVNGEGTGSLKPPWAKTGILEEIAARVIRRMTRRPRRSFKPASREERVLQRYKLGSVARHRGRFRELCMDPRFDFNKGPVCTFPPFTARPGLACVQDPLFGSPEMSLRSLARNAHQSGLLCYWANGGWAFRPP